MSQLVRTNQSSITIPRKELKPGLYIFELSCSFQGVSATTTNLVYVNVTRPQIKVTIEGGSGKTVPWDKELTLIAKGIDPVEGITLCTL